MSKEQQLQGKVVLIMGAGRGLGEATGGRPRILAKISHKVLFFQKPPEKLHSHADKSSDRRNFICFLIGLPNPPEKRFEAAMIEFCRYPGPPSGASTSMPGADWSVLQETRN